MLSKEIENEKVFPFIHVVSESVQPDSADVARFEKKSFWRAAGETVGFNIGLWAFDRYALKGHYAYINWNTIKENFKHGFDWDDDHLNTNMFAHPYNGSLFYNAGRSNGYNFWQSELFAIGGSAMWELFMESEYPSTNDIIATPIGGAAWRSVLSDIRFGIGRPHERMGTVWTRNCRISDFSDARLHANSHRASMGKAPYFRPPLPECLQSASIFQPERVCWHSTTRTGLRNLEAWHRSTLYMAIVSPVENAIRLFFLPRRIEFNADPASAEPHRDTRTAVVARIGRLAQIQPIARNVPTFRLF